jgi:hypothetical protein
MMTTIENETEKFTLADHARVWIFQSDRFFTEEERNTLQLNGKKFAEQWRAHGKELTAQFEVVHNLFVAMSIDEHIEGASGCSIDTFMRFVLEAEKQLGLNLTNRLCFAYIHNDTIQIAKSSEIKLLSSEAKLTKDTLVFDNLISNVGQLKNEWLKPAYGLWLNKMIS